jgi:hypothetical protein
VKTFIFTVLAGLLFGGQFSIGSGAVGEGATSPDQLEESDAVVERGGWQNLWPLAIDRRRSHATSGRGQRQLRVRLI